MDVTAPLGSYLTPSFEHATVGDAMRPWVLSCDPATPLVTVAQRMAGEHVHAIIVLADHGDRRPYAVLTDRELLRVADRVEELTAGEIAAQTVLEARSGEPLSEAARRMADHDATHAVVVDERSGRPGAPYTGLKPAGLDVGPVIGVAEQAIAEGVPDALVELLSGELEREIRGRFAEMLRRQARADGDVDATRDYVEAMLGLQVWAHSLHESIHGDPHEHTNEHHLTE